MTYEALDQDKSMVDDVISRAREMTSAHQYQQVVELLETLTTAAAGTHAPPEHAALLILRSQAYHVLGHWTESEEDARAVVALAPTLADRAAVVEALYVIGELQKDRGNFREAEESQKQSAQLAEAIGDTFGQARSYLALAGLTSKSGGREVASAHLDRCLDLLNALQDDPRVPRVRAAATVQQAVASFREGNVDETMTLCNSALKTLAADPLAAEAGEAHRFLGIAASTRLQHREALEHHLRALHVYKNSGNRFGKAKIYHSIGQSFLEMGRDDEALHFLEKAERICLELGALGEEASLYGQLGRVYLQREEYQKAVEYFRKDLEMSTSRGSGRRALAHIHRNLGQSLRYVGDAEGAIQHCKQSLQLFQQMGDELNTAKIYQDLVLMYARQGNFDRAHSMAQFPVNMFRRLGQAFDVAWTNTLLGIVLRGQKKFSEAEEHFVQALDYFQTRDATARLVRTMYEYGLLLVDAERKPRAMELFVEALRMARSLGLKRQAKRCFEAIEQLDEIQLIRTLMAPT